MKKSDIKREEQLSALLDNALDSQQLDSFMQDLKRDPLADAETAQRYNLIGDAMRDELDQSSFMDISGAVQRAIEQEPVHAQSEQQAPSAFKPLSALTGLLTAWIKPITGMAVAASVAMMTLFTFNTVQNNEADESSVQLAQSAAPQKMSVDIARNVRVASTLDNNSKSIEQQKQINSYMLQHSGYASQSTMQGMMPYVRAADVKSQETE